VWWSAAEPDVLPAEEAARGYNGLTLQHSAEKDKPVHKDLMKYVYDKGQGTGKKEDVGTVLYNRGMTQAMLLVEAIRTAQGKYGKGPVTGEQVRWGLENLNIDAARIKAMGMEGMLQPLKTSCADHTGVYSARIHTWDGKAWKISSDWYTADRSVIDPIIKAGAAKFAEEKKLTPRKCG
jgi:branched-chain amino acid transport system substrate-binding protein